MSSNFRSVALENSLVETPNYNCRLEITVSHPRTKPFVRMSEDHQKNTIMEFIVILLKRKLQSISDTRTPTVTSCPKTGMYTYMRM